MQKKKSYQDLLLYRAYILILRIRKIIKISNMDVEIQEGQESRTARDNENRRYFELQRIQNCRKP